MGFYERCILPWLVKWTMGCGTLHKERHKALAAATGRVLEIGLGNGLNLSHYPTGVTEVVGVDPSPMARRLAQKGIERVSFPVTLHRGSAEALPFPDSAFDTVAMTWTLCTIPNPQQALLEMHRVLKPGGALLFVEHGHSPDPVVARWQNRLNGLQRIIGGGCNLNRPIGDLITGAGFRMDALETFYSKGPRTHTYFYRGVASRQAARPAIG